MEHDPVSPLAPLERRRIHHTAVALMAAVSLVAFAAGGVVWAVVREGHRKADQVADSAEATAVAIKAEQCRASIEVRVYLRKLLVNNLGSLPDPAAVTDPELRDAIVNSLRNLRAQLQLAIDEGIFSTPEGCTEDPPPEEPDLSVLPAAVN